MDAFFTEKRRELEALLGKYQGSYPTDYIHELPTKDLKKYAASDKVNRVNGAQYSSDIVRVAQNTAIVNRDLEPFTEEHVRRSFYLGVNDVAPPGSPIRFASQIPPMDKKTFISAYGAPSKSPVGGGSKGIKRGRPLQSPPLVQTPALPPSTGGTSRPATPSEPIPVAPAASSSSPTRTAPGRTISSMNQAEVLEVVKEIYKTLKSFKFKQWGNKNPFDADIQPHTCAELGVPNYFEVVKGPPMNLTIISRKIQKKEYHALKEFVDDVRLMFRNAFTFNLEGDPIWKCTEKLQKTFNHELKKITTALNIADDEGILAGAEATTSP